jgi:acetyltransferase-like isoleucine patch superfamily enzyme
LRKAQGNGSSECEIDPISPQPLARQSQWAGLYSCKTQNKPLLPLDFFGGVGRGSVIHKPLFIANPQFVRIGEKTSIRPGARIEAVIVNPSQPPSLVIGDNVNIEQNVHLVCSSRLVIENNVSITGNCAIVDTRHPYRDLNDPRKIGDRIDPNPAPVIVGEGSFLGFGCVVLPGVRIGRKCVIGANSVVRADVPDYCVVSGNPAEIVTRYDSERLAWTSTE